MSNNFNKVPIATQTRSRQNLSSTFHGTHDFGRLDVVYCNSDILPGDNIDLKIDGFLRGAPMPAPTYGKIDIDVRVFFVPHRIATSRPSEVGENGFSWDNFISGVSANAHPYATLGDLLSNFNPFTHNNTSYEPRMTGALQKDAKRLFTQLGFPSDFVNYVIASANGLNIDNAWMSRATNMFKFHAYQRVWWDYYRDSQLIDESLIRSYIPLLHAGRCASGEFQNYFHPRYACFRKDYFTTAKLNPQSGVNSAAIKSVSSPFTRDFVGYDPENVRNAMGVIDYENASGSNIPIQWLRAANALQKYLERNNLAGTRLMERFLARFGVTPSSVALDMSEYLGGDRRTLSIGDVTANNEEFGATFDPNNAFNTSSVNGASVGTIQGQLGGKSAGDCGSGNINFHAKEFGTLIAIQTIVPHVSYFEGLDRSETRGVDNDKFAYFTPEMENLGYQPLYRRELDMSISRGNTSISDDIFGYVPRYQDYRFHKDVVSGDLVLSDTSAGMDSWHLGRYFEGFRRDNSTNYYPSLSPDFTSISPAWRVQFDRIFSIPGTEENTLDHFNSVIHTDCNITRPMSASSLPSLDEDLGQNGNVINLENGGVRF